MLAKQAKVLNAAQIKTVLMHIEGTRQPVRNRAIFLLSLRAGLRAKEIAALTWTMVTNSDGQIGSTIRLTDAASKAASGGVIPMATDLQKALRELAKHQADEAVSGRVIRTERRDETSAQVVINLFAEWYSSLGFEGCSSHSGRRTFITTAARNIGRFGGSLRDVQALARHQSIATTQRYIEIDTAAMQSVVNA